MPSAERVLQDAAAALASGRDGDAWRMLVRLVEREPRSPEALKSLIVVQMKTGRAADAEAACLRGISFFPGDFDFQGYLGQALLSLGRRAEAAEIFRTAADRYPDSYAAWMGLATALRDLPDVAGAERAYRRAIALDPAAAEPRATLASMLQEAARCEEAIEAARGALAAAPDHPVVLHQLCSLSNYGTSVTREERMAWHRAYGRAVSRPSKPPTNTRDPERRLRIGYVSPDLRRHSVAYFISAIFDHHDPDGYEVCAYHASTLEDEVTARLKARCRVWRSIHGVDDARVAQLVQRDRVDVLVDLSGHTTASRLAVFGRRPAPVQVTYCGYPGTTGVPEIDWRIVDALTDPDTPETTAEHTERLWRLPRCFLCYTPDEADAAEASALPGTRPSGAAGRGVTFGCFNAAMKISPETIGLFAAVMARVPGSRLLLKSGLLGDASVRERLAARLTERGIDPVRVELLPPTRSAGEHLATYQRVDIALDTYPYHGTTTTCEALWMGVPVVTLAGRFHASRVGVSLLHAAGLADLVADSPEAFAAIAADLAGQPARRGELRAGLRGRVRSSPLCDGAALTRSIEAAYRSMWREWCGAR
ncbi:MAG: tetratricopeptide repeat protein [Phycisphaerales bacterium]|nr:tetratricopeptide repeat protein [Phycisphaerales bacterium]